MSLNITVVQKDLIWEDKKANLDGLGKMISNCKDKMEVVLLPEMFNTGFSMKPTELAEAMDGDAVQWMKQIAAEKKIILSGSLMIKENDKFYNRLIWMLPTGDYGYYDKRHLFAYAGEDAHYTSGHKRLIASVKGWRLNLQVCYDLRFPVWARQAGENEDHVEYDALVYVANWPDKRVHAWRTLLQARAIENQCYVIGVNRVGDDGSGNHYPGSSMIVDAMGAPIYTAGDREEIFTRTLSIDDVKQVRSKLPFLKDADHFKITV